MATLSELLKQIWEVEGVQLQVTSFSQEMMEKHFEDYPYSLPMDGNFTVDDLIEQRIKPAFAKCL